MVSQVVDIKKARKGAKTMSRPFALPNGEEQAVGDGEKKDPWLELNNILHNSQIDVQIREVRHTIEVMEQRITELEMERR